MSTDLDTHARAAAAALRASLAHEPVPEPAVTVRRRPDRMRPLLAGAVAAACLAGALAIARPWESDGERVVAVAPDAPPSRLVPDPLPEGLQVAFALDGADSGLVAVDDPVLVVGGPAAPDGTRPLVTLSASPLDGATADLEDLPVTSPVPVTVQGAPGRLGDSTDIPGTRTLVAGPLAGSLLWVGGRGVTDEQLHQVAEAAVLSADGRIEETAGALPDGFSVVGAGNRRALAVVLGFGAAPGATITVLQPALGDAMGLAVGTIGGNAADLALVAFATGATPVQVDGRDALLGAIDAGEAGSAMVLAWLDGDTLVGLAGTGVSADVLRGAAGHLRRATSDEWAAWTAAADVWTAREEASQATVVDAVSAPTPTTAPSIELVSPAVGPLPGGTPVRLTASWDGALFEVCASTGVCGGRSVDGALAQVGSGETEPGRVVFGLVARTVPEARFVLELTPGERAEVGFADVSADAPALVAAVYLPAGTPLTGATARVIAPDGTVLASLPLD